MLWDGAIANILPVAGRSGGVLAMSYAVRKDLSAAAYPGCCGSPRWMSPQPATGGYTSVRLDGQNYVVTFLNDNRDWVHVAYRVVDDDELPVAEVVDGGLTYEQMVHGVQIAVATQPWCFATTSTV